SVALGIENLYSIWGSDPHTIYVTGLGRQLLHYDGVSWQPVDTQASFALTAVWGSGPSDVFAVGGNGAVTHFDGAQWSNIDIGATLFPNTVWGTATNDVYVMGFAAGAASPAYHWDGMTWTPVPMKSYKGVARAFGVDGQVYAVGQAGLIYRMSGFELVAMPGGNTVDLEAVWVSPNGHDAFAVGDYGTIMHYRNGAWAPMSSPTTHNLRGLGGTCGCSALAVGENGTILQYDGSTWSDVSPGVPANLNEVWVDADGTAFTAGDGGTVWRRENGTWSPLSLGSVTSNLLSVWGSSTDNVYMVGTQSAAFKWIGTQFKPVPIFAPNQYTFHGVFGTGPADVFVAAEVVSAPFPAAHAGGKIFHWDGTQWTEVYADPINDVLSIWRANVDEGYATGDSYTLLRHATTDTGWVRVNDLTNLPFYLNSVWGTSMNNLFVVGDDGAIIRYGR
ncbi:MAG TPA: hypothetical protein VFH88_04840, partial [Candidatus Krumholzibacteria bacterium]|nr:hypothetical protein [Candidatus Krumholzibacteria bacterium]